MNKIVEATSGLPVSQLNHFGVAYLPSSSLSLDSTREARAVVLQRWPHVERGLITAATASLRGEKRGLIWFSFHTYFMTYTI